MQNPAAMSSFKHSMSAGMWRVVFHERRGHRVHVDKTGPWLPSKKMAEQWACWFTSQGYCVALQDQTGAVEKQYHGLPG